ncbi:MAG: S8 family serine peptidase, partial [Ignavibacteriales bacterium]|nr:S8 family serine peptidase [Ignavibacteriales bacterium]
PNKIIVKLKEDIAFDKQLNLTNSQKLNELNVKHNIQSVSTNLKNNSFVFEFNAEKNIEDVISDYENNPDVEYAHPDYYVYLDGNENVSDISGINYNQTPPNDSLFQYQWHLENNGQFNGQNGIDIDLLWGWNIENKGDIVAILDTRIDRNHPDLPLNRLLDEINCIKNDTSSQGTENYHGLALALIIAGESNNGIGISGIAPKTVILPVRILNDYGVGTHSILAQGIYEAVDAGARIINMSVGSYAYSNTLKDAIEYAHSKGAIIICAAGNDNNDNNIKHHFPSDFKECISVGSMDNKGNRSKSSNYGGIDFLAPGEDIIFDSDDGELLTLNGTSSSAAIVTGIVSLIKSYNPKLTNDEIRAILQVSSFDIGNDGYDDTTGYGRVNAFTSLLSTQCGSPGQSFIIINENNSGIQVPVLNVDKHFTAIPDVTPFYIKEGEIYPITITTTEYPHQGFIKFLLNEEITTQENSKFDSVFVNSFENKFIDKSLLVVTDTVYVSKSYSGIIEVEVGNIGSGELNWMAVVNKLDTNWLSLIKSKGNARDTIVIHYEASDSVDRIGKIHVSEELSNTNKTIYVSQCSILHIARDTLFVDSLVNINWEIGKVRRIKHRKDIFSEQGQPVSYIKLEYTIEADSSLPDWFVIEGADSLPVDLGEFTWQVPKTPTNSCKVRISDVINKSVIEITDSIYVIDTTRPTNINDNKQYPNQFCLYQNYPNPFNPVTTIKFDLPTNSYVRLKVYDVLGQEIMTLVNTELNAGYYNYKWDATNFASGIYILRIEASPFDKIGKDFIAAKKVVLLK